MSRVSLGSFLIFTCLANVALSQTLAPTKPLSKEPLEKGR